MDLFHCPVLRIHPEYWQSAQFLAQLAVCKHNHSGQFLTAQQQQF